jgi:hypothetical protein
MKIYSLMSTSGFGGMGKAWIMAWVGLALLVLVFMICKKWLGEEEVTGFPYNWLGSSLGILTYIIVVSLTGSAKWSMLSGFIGLFAGGYGAGMLAE